MVVAISWKSSSKQSIWILQVLHQLRKETISSMQDLQPLWQPRAKEYGAQSSQNLEDFSTRLEAVWVLGPVLSVSCSPFYLQHPAQKVSSINVCWEKEQVRIYNHADPFHGLWSWYGSLRSQIPWTWSTSRQCNKSCNCMNFSWSQPMSEKLE